MRSFRQILTIACLLPLLWACDRELEFEIPAVNPKLVVNSIFTADSTWRIEVSSTGSIDGKHYARSLADVTLMMEEDKKLVTGWRLDSTNLHANFDFGVYGYDTSRVLYYFTHPTHRPKSSTRYELKVDHPDFLPVFANNSIPAVASARPIPASSTVRKGSNNGSYREIRFRIKEETVGEQWYAVEIFSRTETDESLVPIGYFSDDPILTHHRIQRSPLDDANLGFFFRPGSNIYFPNEQFAGNEKDFSLYVDDNLMIDQNKIVLRIHTLSADYYSFLVSYEKYQRSSGDPFAEPAQIYSNITNGLGIFGGYAVRDVVLWE